MLDLDDPQSLVGAVLDRRWRLVGVLGQGGLAVVFEAESVEGQGRVALKILRPEFCEQPDIERRFLSEVQASARVDHPGIARVLEAVQAADGTPYLVMELLHGEPLANRMNRGRVSVEQAVGIIQNVLRALSAAHAAGVVHRDLKPGNIFLVGDTQNGCEVKLLDFGISLVLDAAGGMHRKTRTGMMLGTPGYMSPEQIKDIKHADARTDLWACGILFYELLTGARAYDADNEFERVTKVLTSDPTPIERVAPQLAHWGPFFQRALARDPRQRFQSAYEMAQAIDGIARAGYLPAPFHPAGAVAWPMSHHAAAPPAAAEASPVPHHAAAPPAVAEASPVPHHVAVPPAGAVAAASAVAAAPALPHYPSVPPAPPLHHAAMAPPEPAAAPGPRRFGGDTAVSAGVPGGGPGAAPPSVEVVRVPRQGLSLPLPLALVLMGIALMLGFAAGLLVGKS